MGAPAAIMLISVFATALGKFVLVPITRNQLTMLMEGNTGEAEQAVKCFGVEATCFNEASLC